MCPPPALLSRYRTVASVFSAICRILAVPEMCPPDVKRRSRTAFFAWILSELQSVGRKGPLGPSNIEVMTAEYFEVSQFVAQAQLVVGLKLVPVAGSADALKVLTAIRIPGP